MQLGRNIRYQADLVDHLFNSSEKRLARILLMLAHFGKEGTPDTVVPKISQETLADMVGTTRDLWIGWAAFWGTVAALLFRNTPLWLVAIVLGIAVPGQFLHEQIQKAGLHQL